MLLAVKTNPVSRDSWKPMERVEPFPREGSIKLPTVSGCERPADLASDDVREEWGAEVLRDRS